MSVTRALFAYDNEDSLAGKYEYVEPMYNISHGTCDVRDGYAADRVQLILNNDKTATEFVSMKNKWSGINPKPLPVKQYNGQWLAKNDTLYASFQKGEEAYLITAKGLIELVKLKGGTYVLTEENKAYRGEYRAFKKE